MSIHFVLGAGFPPRLPLFPVSLPHALFPTVGNTNILSLLILLTTGLVCGDRRRGSILQQQFISNVIDLFQCPLQILFGVCCRDTESHTVSKKRNCGESYNNYSQLNKPRNIRNPIFSLYFLFGIGIGKLSTYTAFETLS